MLHLLRKELRNLQCTNFDFPHVIENMKPIENIKVVGGDMFKVNTLPECDVIFTKNVLQDWSNKKYIEVFKNFHNFVKDDGIVVNVSLHLAEPWETQDGWENFSTDMVMLCLFREAKVRTVNEYINSHNKAGFEVVKTVQLGPKAAPQTIIIASKNNCCFHKLGLL